MGAVPVSSLAKNFNAFSKLGKPSSHCAVQNDRSHALIHLMNGSFCSQTCRDLLVMVLPSNKAPPHSRRHRGELALEDVLSSGRHDATPIGQSRCRLSFSLFFHHDEAGSFDAREIVKSFKYPDKGLLDPISTIMVL
jgi:hypothetical protein